MRAPIFEGALLVLMTAYGERGGRHHIGALSAYLHEQTNIAFVF